MLPMRKTNSNLISFYTQASIVLHWPGKKKPSFFCEQNTEQKEFQRIDKKKRVSANIGLTKKNKANRDLANSGLNEEEER